MANPLIARCAAGVCAAWLGIYPGAFRKNGSVGFNGFFEKEYDAWSACGAEKSQRLPAGDCGVYSEWAMCGKAVLYEKGLAGPAEATVDAEGVRS